MSFKNFADYFSERTKHSHGLESDDKGFANRDYDGDLSLKPKPQQRLQPQEYYAPNAQKNPGLMTADGSDRGKPLGDLSSSGLTPKKSMPFGEKPVDKTKKIGGKKKKKLPTKKTMKVESFLEKTKKMNNVQFTKHLLEDVKKVPTPTVRDLYGKEFVPEPAQTMKYVAQLMMTNENMMRRMVRELKRNNAFHLLVSEILTHQETYDCLNEAARGNFGKTIEQKVFNFFEGVSPPRTSPGPASAGSPGGGGGTQGGAFGGGSGPMQGPPAAGISGGTNAGGGFNVNAGGGMGGGMPGAGAPGAGGMQGMGEDEMMGGMPDLSDGPNGMDDDEHDKGLNLFDDDDNTDEDDTDDNTDDMDDDDDDLNDDDEQEEEDEDLDDDEDDDEDDLNFDDEDDQNGGGMMGGGGMGGGMMGGGGMGGM